MGKFTSEYHYQCGKTNLVVQVHFFINVLYSMVLFYLVRIQTCENYRFGSNIHHALVYVIILKMLMGYADIRFLDLCPWLR